MYFHTALAILAVSLCLMSGTFGVRSNQYGKTFVVAMPRALMVNNTPGASNITFSFYSISFHKFPVNLTSEEALCNYSIIMVGNKELALHSMLDCTGSRLNDSVVTRSAYRAVGTDLFSMWLSVNHGPSSTELMLAVPTEGWGNIYYAVTLRYIPSVLVISLTETKVMIKLRIKSEPGMLNVIEYKNKTYGNNDTIVETLPRRSAFELINCVNSKKMYGEFTGTQIIGSYPIGVVTGNCLGVTSNSECFVTGKPENETVSPNLVLEYLLPAESYGKTFFVLPAFEDPLSTYLMVVAAADGTTLTVTTNITTFIKIDKQGDSFQINNGAKPYSISSSRPVQVTYIRRSACMPFNSYKGYATMSLLIPTELFLDMYHWTAIRAWNGLPAPDWKTSDLAEFKLLVNMHDWMQDATPFFEDEYRIVHHVILVAPNDSHANILIDGQLLSVKKMTWMPVEGAKNWSVGNLALTRIRKPHELITTAKKVRFGCYLLGLSAHGSYMMPAGFIAASLYEKGCVKSDIAKTKNSDFVDNDCDGRVDEEDDNDIDDDNDGLIDEDLGNPLPVNGRWSVWTVWICASCNSSGAEGSFRERKCNNPAPLYGGHYCIGNETEQGTGPCTCPFSNANATGNKTFPYFPDKDSEVPGDKKGWEDEAYWDEWTEWKCMEPCDLDKMFRFRKCYHKKELKISELCQGLRTEDMPANCKNRCAQACPLGKWRKDCQGDCSNCEDDCNKLTGYCARCKPGFQNNNMSCSDVCGPDKYGFMCQSQCSIKCNGEDCVERVTGSCPERSNVMWLTLLLLLFPPIMILLFLRYKHIQAGREDPLAFIVESPSNLGVTASKKSLGTSRSKQSMKSTKSKPSMRSLATGLDGKKKEKRANTSDTTGSEVN